MKIGLVDLDSKLPNLALMKLSAYYKQQGHTVKWWNFLEPFDQIFASKIFTWSTFPYLPKTAIIGGSGSQDLKLTLDPRIEHCYPDYTLYKIDYAMGYVTRGCINHCPFCIVPQKKGKLIFNAHIEEFWSGQDRLMLLDNSITDSPEGTQELEKIRELRIRLKLPQGFNVRIITRSTADILSQIRLWDSNSQWYVAFDDVRDGDLVSRGLQILFDAGIKPYRIMVYILVGYNSTFEQDIERILFIKSLGCDPFVMVYEKNPFTTKLAKWVNRKEIFNSCSFEEFYQTQIEEK